MEYLRKWMNRPGQMGQVGRSRNRNWNVEWAWKTRVLGTGLCLLAVFLFSPHVAAQTYEYVDEKGTVTFTDDLVKVPPKYQEQAKERTPARQTTDPPPRRSDTKASRTPEESTSVFSTILTALKSPVWAVVLFGVGLAFWVGTSILLSRYVPSLVVRRLVLTVMTGLLIGGLFKLYVEGAYDHYRQATAEALATGKQMERRENAHIKYIDQLDEMKESRGETDPESD